MSDRPAAGLAGRARAAIADPALERLLDSVTVRLTERRAAAVAAVPDWEALRERGRHIRQRAVARLDHHLAEFERQATARGAVVHRAATAEDARRIVLEIAKRHGVRRVVKGKSMVSEEIHLNDALAAGGIAAVETDLGEYIVQLAGQAPSHIIAPALHMSRGDVARLFADKLGMPLTDDPAALTLEARRRLRAEFARADMGTSGVNLAVAETGTIVLLENEGNIRLSTSMPRVHVALMGIERIVPRAGDLPVLLALLPRSATGQPMATYTSLLTGPRRSGETDGPDELHIVMIDNGRSRLAADPSTREALACIRCGACLNACPVYRTIGGHAYGTVYSGPIGSVISAYLQPGGAASELPFASTLCGACAEVCPVKIDLPELLVRLRGRKTDAGGPAPPHRGFVERAGMRVWAWAMESPRRYKLASSLMRRGLGPRTRDGAIRDLPGRLGGWTASRDLPAPAAEAFRELWAARRASHGSTRTDPEAERTGGRSTRLISDSRPVSSPERVAPAPVETGTTSRPSRTDLLRHFTSLSEEAEAPVTVVASAEAARARVMAILETEAARSVVVSPDAAGDPWRCLPAAGGVVRGGPSPGRDAALAADAGVTLAAYGLADTGTLVLCSSAGDHRLDSLLPPLHVAILRARDIVPDLAALFDRLAADRRLDKHSAVTFVRGPSRTADIELTLTVGVHGPGRVRVVVAGC